MMKGWVSMTDGEIFNKLISNVEQYHPSSDFSMLEKAYALAKEAHAGQLRRSGEPYIVHPLEVAVILSEIHQDRETLAAALLHDVVEDTHFTYEDIVEQFGEEVALLVNGLTDLEKLENETAADERAKNYRKLFVSMAQDIRVILIKIADRLHNLRTLKYMPPANQQKKAQEAIDIYAPFAHKLGISKLRREMEDLSLQYLHPNTYKDIDARVKKRRIERGDIIEASMSTLGQRLYAEGIAANTDFKAKNNFNIYKKMLDQNIEISQVYELFSLLILVETPRDCYAALGIVHNVFKPLNGRFEDHIAIPKDNRYQALHSVVTGPEGDPFEVQIRTHEMQRISEFGVTANWRYTADEMGLFNEGKTTQKYEWLSEMLDWQRDISDNVMYLDALKEDLNAYKGHIYCFTPKGDTKSLLTGSTALDFAYAVHSAVGNRMIGAKVNNRIVTIAHVLKTGDRVEIITSQNAKGPSRDWLDIAKTSQARSRITHWFKSQNKDANIAKGVELLEKTAKNKGIPLSELQKDIYINPILRRFNLTDWEAVCAAVGHGDLREALVINRLYDEYIQATNPAAANKKASHNNQSGITVKGAHGQPVRLSKCCGPIIGDEIVAYITRERGATIHRTDCAVIVRLDSVQRKRLADAEWANPLEANPGALYQVELFITVQNRYGMFYDILDILKNEKINVHSCDARPDKKTPAQSFIDVKIEVPTPQLLENILLQLNNVNGILNIRRV